MVTRPHRQKDEVKYSFTLFLKKVSSVNLTGEARVKRYKFPLLWPKVHKIVYSTNKLAKYDRDLAKHVPDVIKYSA